MSRRILIVDDDPAMVKTLCDILQLCGWEPTAAYSGAEAVSVMIQEPYPVVLMDIRMPGMDGVEAFREMKQRYPDVRVVLMTAYTSPELLREAEREGAMRVLAKPVDVDELLPVLQRGLRAARPVLLIDDDPSFLRTLAESLRLQGFRVVTADHPRELNDSIGQRTPAAIVLHLRLAKELARDAIDTIRRLDEHVPLVVYSGDAPSVASAKQLLPAAWISAYLEKPLAFERLNELLDAAVAGRLE